MHRALIWAILMAMLTHTGNAQSNRVDELNQLAWEWKHRKPDSALAFAQQALEEAQATSNLAGEAIALKRFAIVHRILGAYEKAHAFYDEALLLETQLGNQAGQASVYSGRGTTYLEQGKYEEALLQFQHGLAIQLVLGNAQRAAGLQNNIGLVYRHQSRYEEALNAYLTALRLAEDYQDSSLMARTLNNLGILSTIRRDFPKALEFYARVENIYQDQGDAFGRAETYLNMGTAHFGWGNLEEAARYLSKSLSIEQQLGHLRGMADAQNNLGLVFLKQGNTGSAQKAFRRSIQLNLEMQDPIGQAAAEGNYGMGCRISGKLDSALRFVAGALEVARSNQNSELEKELQCELAQVYDAKGNQQLALTHYKRYTALNDSLSKQVNSPTMAALESDFANEKLARKMLLIEKDLELKKERNKLLVGGVAALLGALLLLFAVFQINRKRLRARAEVAAKNEEIGQSKIQSLLQAQEIQAMQARLEGRENERQRIARDLHDRLGSVMATIKYRFETLDSTTGSAQAEFDHVNALIDEACGEVRRVAHNMNGGLLDRSGLIYALQSLAETLTVKGEFEVEVIDHGLDDRLSDHLEISIYRIIQELMSNVLKHARASRVFINLTLEQKHLNIMLEDNGVGFDPQKLGTRGSAANGLGLQSVRQRVSELHGVVSIDSQSGHGTTVVIDLEIN